MRCADSIGRFGRADLVSITALCAFALVQTLFAVHLNSAFYALNGPFYDSMSYLNNLARVYETSRAEGIIAGLNLSIKSSTVVLPYLLAATVSPFVDLSRSLGVWLQMPWIAALLCSCYALFRVRMNSPPLVAFALSIPFTSIAALYNFNGGLSDFRMDLHLYLLFGCSVCWFSIAMHEPGRVPAWLICGVFCGLAALARATAPVYILLVFGPALAIRFVLMRSERWSLLKGAVYILLVAAGLAGWFYVVRFEQLYYYYVVWNSDANANLPLSHSLRHVNFAVGGIGVPLFASSIVGSLILVSSRPSLHRLCYALGRWPWELALAAIMPCAFLALRGAGLNPFVSMPSTFGILAVILGLRGNFDSISNPRACLAAVVIWIGCGLSAFHGLQLHGDVHAGRMASFSEILGIAASDAERRGLDSVTVSGVALGYLCGDAITNVLVFDREYTIEGYGRSIGPDLVVDVGLSPGYSAATYVDWSKIKGNSDYERVQHLAKRANRRLNYLIVPDDSTLEMLETRMPHNYINRYSRWLLKEILEDGEWVKLSGPIAVTDREIYYIYSNQEPAGSRVRESRVERRPSDTR